MLHDITYTLRDAYLADAISCLGAIPIDHDQYEYAYIAKEDGRWYGLDESEVARLGELRARGMAEAYSDWCNDCYYGDAMPGDWSPVASQEVSQ